MMRKWEVGTSEGRRNVEEELGLLEGKWSHQRRPGNARGEVRTLERRGSRVLMGV